MKTWKLSIVAAVLMAVSGGSYAGSGDSIFLGHSGLRDWQALDRDRMIMWATPSKPYLVEIWRPATSLKFVHTIGYTTTGGRITEWDQVVVDGIRVPIRSITRLEEAEAKALQ